MTSTDFETKFSKLQTKYADYIEIERQIFNMKPGECQDLVTKIIDFQKKTNFFPLILLSLISYGAEFNLRNLREYLSLYDQIKNKFDLHPNQKQISKTMTQIYANLYPYEELHCYIPEDKKKHSLEEIFSFMNPDSILNIIFNDDIIKLQEFFMENPTTDFDLKIEAMPLIQHCCAYGSIKCLRFLRSNGAKLTKSCLYSSIDGRNKEIISECLSVIPPDLLLVSPAIRAHDLDLFVTLYQTFDIPADSSFINPILIYSFLEGFIYLIAFANNLDSLFLYSCQLGIEELIFDIIDFGANVNSVDYFNRTILFYNELAFYPETMLRLSTKGIDIEHKDDNQKTALFSAVENKRLKLAKALIKIGANVNVHCKNGDTPLIVASRTNKGLEMIKMLLSSAAKIDETNNEKSTALIEAVRYNMTENAEYLISVSADVNAKNNKGWTPIFYAILANQTNLVSKLIEKHADLNVKNSKNHSPLSLAIKTNNTDIADILKKAGAKI